MNIPVEDIRRIAILAKHGGDSEWTREAGANVLIWLKQLEQQTAAPIAYPIVDPNLVLNAAIGEWEFVADCKGVDGPSSPDAHE